ncbi:MAG: hypothetical protein WCP32_05000 [Bacteroidota bacterium]
MRFYALDVETAYPDQSTICQIGIGLNTESSLSRQNGSIRFR